MARFPVGYVAVVDYHMKISPLTVTLQYVGGNIRIDCGEDVVWKTVY